MANFVADILARLNTNEVEGQIKSIENTPIKFQNVSISTNELVSKIQSELNKLKIDVKFDSNGVQSFVKGAQSQGTKAGDSFAKGFSKSAERIQFDISSGKTDASLSKLTARFDKLKYNSGSKNEYSDIANQIKQAQKLNEVIKTSAPTEAVSKYKEFYEILARVGNSMTVAESGMKNQKVAAEQLSNKFQKLKADYEAWFNKNKKAAGQYKEYADSLISGAVNENTPEAFSRATTELAKMKSEAKAAGLTTDSFAKSLKNAALQAVGLNSVYDVFQKAVQVGKQMYQNVVEIDTAMTNLYKVTDETSERYDRFLSNSATSAKDLGRSVSSLIEQSATWAKLGYSIDESERLAKVSSIYANTGEVDDETAVSDLVTAMKAFDIASSDAMTIVDSLNELGKRIARR